MDERDFEAAVRSGDLPAGAPALVRALWHEARGEWDRAHTIAQADDGPDGAWVHAYLHRAEGDLANAGYWYRRAGRPAADGPLADERAAIVQALLGR